MSFRGAQSANLRCVIAHREISQFRVRLPRPGPRDLLQVGGDEPGILERIELVVKSSKVADCCYHYLL